MIILYSILTTTEGPSQTTIVPISRTIIMEPLSSRVVSIPPGDNYAVQTWTEKLDPADTIDFKIVVSDQIDPDDSLVSYTLTIPAESQLQGLQLDSHSRDGNEITLWLSMTENPLGSLTLPVELTITTALSRTRQRTVLLQVSQL